MAKVNLQEIKGQSFTWVNIIHPTELDAKQLARRFHFNSLDLKDILPPIQRPKLLERENYLFMILLFPIYNRETRRIHPVEVDFFIGNNFLVTTTSEDLFPLRDLFVRCQKGKSERDVCATSTPAPLLHEILNRLRLYCSPMLVHVGNDVDRVEEEVFAGRDDKKTINEVLLIKTNIVNFRKALNRHGRVVQHLAAKIIKICPDCSRESFKILTEDMEDLWAVLENFQDTIDAIHESQLSLLNYRSNATMQLFTVLTTIIFTLELVISLVALSIDYQEPLGLAAIFSGLTLTGLIMIFFFKKRKWI